jgi:hypothetical protein
MFLINSNIKQVLLAIIFSAAISSGITASQSDTKIKKTINYIKSGSFNCFVAGSASVSAIMSLQYLAILREDFNQSICARSVFCASCALGLISGIVSQYNKDQVKAKIQDYIEVQQRLEVNNQENQKEFSFSE